MKPSQHDQEREANLAHVLEDVMLRRSRGESLPNGRVCEEHQELMPDLLQRLAALDVIERAEEKLSGPIDSDRMFNTHTISPSDWENLTGNDNAAGGEQHQQFPRMAGYKILGVLGHGGMGVVYRAIQLKLNRVVALKVLPAVVGIASPSAVARFRREAAAAARLHHTNIVPVHDFGESEDGYYYAMELVQGKPMDELIHYLRRRKKFCPNNVELQEAIEASANGNTFDSLEQMPSASSGRILSASSSPSNFYRRVAKWMADAADALHFAHEQGIIHRDVKPSNLLISIDGRVMVADFGLAKTSEDQTITGTGVMLGTVMYLSPEQAQSADMVVDSRTDIYSLGATLFDLVCQRPVFIGDNEREVIAAIITQEPTSPRKLVPSIPAELETICLKALEKDPGARYQTAAEMAQDLRRFIDDRPIVAKRPSLLKRTMKFVRRHRSAVIAATALLLLGISIATGLYLTRKWEEAAQEALIQEGVRLTRLNDISEVLKGIDLLALAIEHDGGNVRALGNMCIAKKDLYNLQENPDSELLTEASTYCDAALEIAPDNVGILNAKAVVSKKQGRFEEAIRIYNQARAIDPNAVWLLNNIATIYILQGDLLSAERTLLEATSVTGTLEAECDVYTWRRLGVVRIGLKYPEVNEQLRQALRCNNQDDWARIHLAANIMRELEDGRADVRRDDVVEELWEDIVAVFKDWSESKPIPAPFYRVRAEALYLRGRWSRAEENATAALENGDLATPAKLILAMSAARQGDLDTAQRFLEEAIDDWPTALAEPGSLIFTPWNQDLWIDMEDDLQRLLFMAEQAIQGKTEKRG